MAGSMVVVFVFLALAQYVISERVNVYRYWLNGENHFYTTNGAEIGVTTAGVLGNHGYVSEGVGFKIETENIAGTVPLYRYYSSSAVDHFYTTNANEIGVTTAGLTGNHGYTSEGVLGYCFDTYQPDTVPLYKYYQPEIEDHFYTTITGEIGTGTAGQTGSYGYVSGGIQCYVYAW